MKTYIAQFCLPGSFGIGHLDPDSMQQQKQLSEALALDLLLGKATLTGLQQSQNGLQENPSGPVSRTAQLQTIVEINLCLNEDEGSDFAKHTKAITEKAAATLKQSKMFLSYLWKKNNTEHIGLDPIFV